MACLRLAHQADRRRPNPEASPGFDKLRSVQITSQSIEKKQCTRGRLIYPVETDLGKKKLQMDILITSDNTWWHLITPDNTGKNRITGFTPNFNQKWLRVRVFGKAKVFWRAKTPSIQLIIVPPSWRDHWVDRIDCVIDVTSWVIDWDTIFRLGHSSIQAVDNMLCTASACLDRWKAQPKYSIPI